MTTIRQRIVDAYDDIECPHSDHYPADRDGNYVTVPCGNCVADAVIGVIAAPTEGQHARVDAIEDRLIATEVARTLEAASHLLLDLLADHWRHDPPGPVPGPIPGLCASCGGTGERHGPGANGNWTGEPCGCDMPYCGGCGNVWPCPPVALMGETVAALKEGRRP